MTIWNVNMNSIPLFSGLTMISRLIWLRFHPKLPQWLFISYRQWISDRVRWTDQILTGETEPVTDLSKSLFNVELCHATSFSNSIASFSPWRDVSINRARSWKHSGNKVVWKRDIFGLGSFIAVLVDLWLNLSGRIPQKVTLLSIKPEHRFAMQLHPVPPGPWRQRAIRCIRVGWSVAEVLVRSAGSDQGICSMTNIGCSLERWNTR
jgi:hypothetical protein